MQYECEMKRSELQTETNFIYIHKVSKVEVIKKIAYGAYGT